MQGQRGRCKIAKEDNFINWTPETRANFEKIKQAICKEGPYQDRPPLCPFRLLPLLIYSGSTIASLKFQGAKSKNIENKILLQP